ncbi:MAG: CBS domain-containing protein [Gammaproteobacteria bacterium]|nr:CBS domain-containing protein [Gammaproteobacteria bacterium]
MSTKKIIRVRDVMSDSFLEIDGLATVEEALQKMKAINTDVVIVKRRDQNDEFGIMLLADIAKKVLARNRAPERVNVYEIMSKPVIDAPPNMKVRYCARLFERFGLSVAPVIENDAVIGVVSYNELVLKGLLHDVE